MNLAEYIDKWKRDGRTVSITVCDGMASALVFNGGEPYTVRDDGDGDFLEQIDNLVEDRVFRDCRMFVG